MKNKDHTIAEELRELGVSLEHKPDMPLQVPAGYFDTFQKDTLKLVSAIDYVKKLPKSMPQTLPVDYFDTLKRNVMSEIAVTEFEASLPKRMPQSVPNDYFAKSKAEVLSKLTQSEQSINNDTGLISTRTRKKRSWALAASMALIISAGLFFMQADHSTLNLENELAQVSEDLIDDYIETHEYDFEAYDILENPQLTSQSMQSLEEEILLETENLSNEEIFEFVL